eukprot:CAMPEP_0174895742 /NCGR_PEP_ID=MMETSP0167-20121228/10075_1 /TAXON_ID=38298 /ORGANISM="Rhodella maculata, Strain CCMP736" /LENGTH=139 /DNA_ID=CAMNT_0016135143 /DNA_START=120 /DNA_END=539 /DNA_ORIENTATION=-
MAPVSEEDSRMDKPGARCGGAPAAEAAEAADSTSGGVDDDRALETFVVAMNSAAFMLSPEMDGKEPPDQTRPRSSSPEGQSSPHLHYLKPFDVYLDEVVRCRARRQRFKEGLWPNSSSTEKLEFTARVCCSNLVIVGTL